MGYLDTRLGSLPRTGTFVQSLGSFNTLAELNATHPANNYNPGTTAYTVDQGFMISDGSVWESPGMVPGEEDVTAATYAAARLLSGAATGARLQVRGRTSQSDGGQGLFTWVAGGSTTINDGSQLTAPGGIWQRPDTTIQAQWYGVDPTGVAASDVALNVAIQDAIIRKMKLVIPSGLFTLNAPLLCYSLTSAFSTLKIEGQGHALTATNAVPTAAVYYPNTILYTNFTDRPALVYNANRDLILSNLAIVGQNVTPASQSPPNSTSSNYVTGGCRDSRYSPYCGIAIDSGCANAPPDGGYSGFTYPYLVGTVGSGTSGLLVENVLIHQFVVGVMMTPSTGAQQGDKFKFRNVDVSSCRVAYAWGQSQSRANIIEHGNIGNVQCAFDGLTYGAQTGTSPKVYGTQLGPLYNIMNLGGQGPAVFNGVYAESILSLGTCRGTEPLTMVGCSFSFNNSSASWLQCCTALECASPVHFIGCHFDYSTSVIEAFNFPGSRQVTFEECRFSGVSTTGVMPFIGVQSSQDSAVGAKLKNCFVTNVFGGSSIQISDDSFGRTGNGFGAINLLGFLVGRFIGTYQTRIVNNGYLDYLFVPPVGYTPDIQMAGGLISAMTLNATTVTFTLTNASNFLCENDILMWKMIPPFGSGLKYSIPALKIPVGGISGSSVTANMLFDPAQYDTVGNQASSTSVWVFAHMWAPNQALTCTTNTSTSLTAVSPVACLRPGDFIIGIGANATDIPAKCRVVSTDGAGNVTISLAATGSHTGVRLCSAQLNQLSNTVAYPAGNTGTTPTPNFANGSVQSWTMNNNVTWGAPTNPPMGPQTLTLVITSTGAFTTAWNATYRNAPAWAAAAAGQTATAQFMYDGINWQFIGGSAAFA